MSFRIVFIFGISLASVHPASAQGWTDFELSIDDNYKIVKSNTLDIALCRADGTGVISPLAYEGVGPIVEYAVTPMHIFTRNHGRMRRGLFAGDTFEDVDKSREYFFIVTKADDSVRGPLSEAEFVVDPSIRATGPIDWDYPWNPIGFVCLAIPLAIPVSVILVAWLLRWAVSDDRASRESNNASTETI